MSRRPLDLEGVHEGAEDGAERGDLELARVRVHEDGFVSQEADAAVDRGASDGGDQDVDVAILGTPHVHDEDEDENRDRDGHLVVAWVGNAGVHDHFNLCELSDEHVTRNVFALRDLDER